MARARARPSDRPAGSCDLPGDLGLVLSALAGVRHGELVASGSLVGGIAAARRGAGAGPAVTAGPLLVPIVQHVSVELVEDLGSHLGVEVVPGVAEERDLPGAAAVTLGFDRVALR